MPFVPYADFVAEKFGPPCGDAARLWSTTVASHYAEKLARANDLARTFFH
jgi:hypothetical protein